MEPPFAVPRTPSDLARLVELRVPESIHVDYKRSDSLTKRDMQELTKDVSAFANSDGGVLVYGVTEVKGVPTGFDVGLPRETRLVEWFDQILATHVLPRIEGVELIEVVRDVAVMDLVVMVPRSTRAPHQAQDKKYYKRSNCRNEPMEDYEVRDVMARVARIPPLVRVDLEVRGFVAYLVVHNPGPLVAREVRFAESETVAWPHGGTPPTLFLRGTSSLPPGQRIPFLLGSLVGRVHEPGDARNRFAIEVSYEHPLATSRFADRFEFDLSDLWGSAIVDSPAEQAAKPLADELKRIRDGLEKLAKHSEALARISGATGLDLSITSLRNLARIASGEPVPVKLNPFWQSHEVFREVLGADLETALALEGFFRSRDPDSTYPPSGIDESILQTLEACFDLKAWEGARRRLDRS